MDGEVNGAQAAGVGQQVGATPQQQADGGQQAAQSQGEPAQQTVGAGGDGDGAASCDGASGGVVGGEDYRAALAERDAKISALEAQVAAAAKSAEAADSLAKQIEEMKAANEEERIGFELKLAGVRSVTAAKALLGEHGGDVGKLKAAEPWLFVGEPASGATGLEPAGAASGGDELKRWREIAGLE